MSFWERIERIRIERHHRIRNIIANKSRENKNFEVHEEVTIIVANNRSIRRCYIIVNDKIKSKRIIFTRLSDSKLAVHSLKIYIDDEKMKTYNPTIA